MKPIPCNEPGCTAMLVNPCGTVQALFAFRHSLEKKDRGEMSEQEKERHITLYTESIKDTGLEEPEKAFKAYKKLMPTPLEPSKHFVLKCIKGHVNTYEISCTKTEE